MNVLSAAILEGLEKYVNETLRKPATGTQLAWDGKLQRVDKYLALVTRHSEAPSPQHRSASSIQPPLLKAISDELRTASLEARAFEFATTSVCGGF